MDNMPTSDQATMPTVNSTNVAPPAPQRDHIGGTQNMAQGGLTTLADKVQSKGRDGDSMLVHMSPEEVKGLQYLAMRHGGSLTINPKTGLVEANFLKSILPVIAGAALAPFTGGASMAGLLVGGGTALMTGSLEKGLMAGLGAFGGASLAGSLSAAGAGAGASGLSTTAAAPVTSVGQTAAALTPQAVASPYALSSGAGAASGMGLGGGITAALPQATTAAGALTPTAAASGLTLPGAVAAPVSQVAGAITPAAAPITYSNMGAGIKALGTEAGRSQFMTAMGGPSGLATKVVAPIAAGSMFSAEEPDEPGKKPQEYIRPYSFDFNRADADPAFRYRTGEAGESTAEKTYLSPEFTSLGVFKAGTEPGGSFYGTPTAAQYDLYSKPKDNILNLATGGITTLKKGRFLDDATDRTGESDGMSDDFPAVINGEQPARLTDGEFVVPADVVSHLGNGSSKAGAKRLHVMMDRIRKARTGNKKQAPEVKAERFMPA